MWCARKLVEAIMVHCAQLRSSQLSPCCISWELPGPVHIDLPSWLDPVPELEWHFSPTIRLHWHTHQNNFPSLVSITLETNMAEKAGLTHQRLQRVICHSYFRDPASLRKTAEHFCNGLEFLLLGHKRDQCTVVLHQPPTAIVG